MKPCWIRRASDGTGPEVLTTGLWYHLCGNGSVATPCLQAGRFVPVYLPLMYIYQSAIQNWHWSAGVLVIGASGSFCGVKIFTLITSGFTAFIIITV